MDDRVMRLAGRVKEHLARRYGSNIDRVLLYGSHARDEGRESSDIDLLVVVRDAVEPREVRESLDELLLDIIIEEGELVSVIAIPEEQFNHYRSPFLVNVRGEGVLV